jgi:transcriptional regulator with XRE-family HTH domain
MFQNFGRALIRLRKRAGKSQSAIAGAAGMGKSQLSKYENSKELPKLESLERVLLALGVGYFEFFRVLDVIDRGEPGTAPPTREDIEECFTRITRGVFALHHEIVKKLPDYR